MPNQDKDISGHTTFWQVAKTFWGQIAQIDEIVYFGNLEELSVGQCRFKPQLKPFKGKMLVEKAKYYFKKIFFCKKFVFGNHF